jgi:hypothetical protein
MTEICEVGGRGARNEGNSGGDIGGGNGGREMGEGGAAGSAAQLAAVGEGLVRGRWAIVGGIGFIRPEDGDDWRGGGSAGMKEIGNS